MNSALLSLLQANGCDQQIFDPPLEFEASPNIIDQEEMFANFDSGLAYNLYNNHNDEDRNQDNYMVVRHAYLTEVNNQKKLDESDEKFQEFKRIAKEGNIDELLELFKQKHTWKKAVFDERTNTHFICDFEYCTNVALPGMKYCPNHIHLDEHQKIFVQCPICLRNHLVMSKCPNCD